MRRIVEPYCAAAPFPAWWTPLYERSTAASIYLSEAWMRTWIETYGERFRGRWVRWDEGGDAVGGCLLLERPMRKAFLPLRTAFLNATGQLEEHTPLAEFNAFLGVPGREDAIADDLASVLREARWDRMMLAGHEEGGALDRIARSLPATFVRDERRPAPYTDLGAVARSSLDACLSGNSRAQIRRSRRLYEERFGPVALETAGSLEETLQRLCAMAELHQASWRARGEAGSFATASDRIFHERLVRRLWPGGSVDLLRVRAGQADIGYLYNFKARGKVYSFQSGFAYPDDARLKPGLVAHACAIEHYAREGWREYDFLAGDARYKRSFASAARTLCWTTIYRDKPWLRLGAAAWRLKSRLAARGAAA